MSARPWDTHVVIHYGETGLKAGNRPRFETALAVNIRRRVAEKVRRAGGRLVLSLLPDSDRNRIRAALEETFGIANFAFAARVPLDPEAIQDKALEIAQGAPPGSFKIAARRANKRFPLTSEQINRQVGAAVAALGRPVRLTDPDLTIHVEVAFDAAYLYTEVLLGPGGLPVGVSGRVLALISGGIDSPVAALLAMKRGCKCLVLHFHNYSFYEAAVRQKILDLAAVLARFNGRTKVLIVPFLELQKAIVHKVPADSRMLVYRRAMFRIAEILRRREGAKALVTGDNLAQVASQTLDNLRVIYAVAPHPVIAPLMGYDKNDVVQLARRFGTYDISIRPYEDCCSAFVARHPQTRGRLEEIEAWEREIEMEPLIARLVEQTETVMVRPSGVERPVAAPEQTPSL